MLTLATGRRLEGPAARYFTGSANPARLGEALTGSEIVVELMRLVGADVIFGIPGGASLPLNDALTEAHAAGVLRYVLTGHEQGAAFEAEGYAAASGRVGFCTATSGPGATNLVTGLADALRDSRPVVAVTGNTATTAEPEAFQAIDIVGITNGRATKLSLRPARADDVQMALITALHAAVTGRPGSVLVDLPKDVQAGRAILRPWQELIDTLDWTPPGNDLTNSSELAAAVALLLTAERPLIYAGHGVVASDAATELRDLSHLLDAPVATTLHGLGLLPSDDPLNLGMIGMHGTMVANIAPHLADVVLAVGARFDDRVVGARPERFAPTARLIHIDVDAYQLNRVRAVDVALHADVKLALRAMLEQIVLAPHAPRARWLRQIQSIRRAMPIQTYDRPESQDLTHEHVYGDLARGLREAGVEDVVATFDVGTHQMKGAQWFPVLRPRSFVTSGGMGSMGCALPMAAGAALARPGATVLACVGDGGFVMSSHELDTIGGYQLPVKIVLFDDAALGMVTNWHGLFFGGRNLTSDRRRGRPAVRIDAIGLKRSTVDALEQSETTDEVVAALAEAAVNAARGEWPAFALVAASYGIPSERVHSKAQLRGALRRALSASGPYLVHVVLPRQNQVYPLMQPGTTPQEMVWRESYPGSGQPVLAGERFDYETGTLRPDDPLG